MSSFYFVAQGRNHIGCPTSQLIFGLQASKERVPEGEYCTIRISGTLDEGMNDALLRVHRA
jgi:hypothetical protein